MADKKGGGEKKSKGVSRGKLYTKEGDKMKAKNRHCPKCGPGFFMGAHSNRAVCGKCGYTEMQTKKAEAKAE